MPVDMANFRAFGISAEAALAFARRRTRVSPVPQRAVGHVRAAMLLHERAALRWRRSVHNLLGHLFGHARGRAHRSMKDGFSQAVLLGGDCGIAGLFHSLSVSGPSGLGGPAPALIARVNPTAKEECIDQQAAAGNHP